MLLLQSGGLHDPISLTAQTTGTLGVRLEWEPEYYTTFLYMISASSIDSGEFVEIDGPLGAPALYQYVVFGEEAFMAGTADLTVPSSGPYWMWIAPVAWDAATWGASVPVYVDVP